MVILWKSVRPTEGFYVAAPNEAKNVAYETILPMSAHVAYNGRRAEGPCGKTMLGDPVVKRKIGMNIQLPSDAMQFVEGLVTSGEFESTNDAITEGVRLLMSRKLLRADIQKGINELDAGLGIDGDEVFSQLRARAKAAVEGAS